MHSQPITRPDAVQFEVGQFFVHFMNYRAGAMLDTHAHKYPHMLLVASGSVRLRSGERDVVLYAPAAINIPAGVAHDIEAITDSLAACVHICRLPNGEVFPFGWTPSEHAYSEARAAL